MVKSHLSFIIHFVFLLNFVLDRTTHSYEYEECDDNNKPVRSEGNIGQKQIFPWIGVIKAVMRKVNEYKVAATGVILVKTKYAIGNANDIARIPPDVFKADSKAMFIPWDGKPWYCKLDSYKTHPEFEFSTYNTVALIEITWSDSEDNPVKPLCWPNYFYNASNQLYAVGFTDENELLEKTFYKLQYVEKSMCEEFYNRAGLSENYQTPSHYQCGFAVNNKGKCDWENGMALVSNTTGHWVLIGLSVKGPGCSAPARFIDVFHYLDWIETSTTNARDYNDYNVVPYLRKTELKSNITK